MKYHYQNAIRWFRWDKDGDVRLHRPPNGWEAEAILLDNHPITGRAFRQAQWWICETFHSDQR